MGSNTQQTLEVNLLNNQTTLHHQSRFCIGVLSFNHPEITARTLQSCLSVTPNTPITILHNGSEKRWIQKLQEQFPQIEHLIVPSNRGFTGGINTLLEHLFAKFEWCLFLTNDLQLVTLDCPQVAALVAPLIHRRKMGLIDSIGGHFVPQTGALIHCRSRRDFDRTPPGTHQYIPGTAFWIHREVFKEVGLFDTSLGTYWEDVDYSQRVALKDLPLLICEKTQLVHSVGKTCHKHKFYTSYLFVRNKYYVSLKYNPKWSSRQLFRLNYWRGFLIDSIKASIKKDTESLYFKKQILKDLILNRGSRFKENHDPSPLTLPPG